VSLTEPNQMLARPRIRVANEMNRTRQDMDQTQRICLARRPEVKWDRLAGLSKSTP
jgi:hypothetical protein